MNNAKPEPAMLDLIARAQLALVHAVVVRPTFDWSVVQQLAAVWQATNARRYQQLGLATEDIRASLRMAFRDYLAEVRADNPEEAERLRQALGPELDA